MEKMLNIFKHLGFKEISNPFDYSTKLNYKTSGAIALFEYASVIGSLMYTMHYIRPDITYFI